MVVFENQLKKLKYLVLKEVAKMALADRLGEEDLERIPFDIIKGDKAEYRCCVYKERAIVYERAKLATGCLPNGQVAEEFIHVEDEDQIIYVIDAACDKCPINKYVVTETCRGCIQHKCMEVCPAGSINRAAGKAYINHETCKECGLCKSACPYNAIAEIMRPCRRACPTGALQMNLEDNKATINKKDCINCGACMAACPFGAISDKSYIVNVTKALKNKKKVYALVAPAITGQFGKDVPVGKMKNAFKAIGFEDMLEVACGADLVAAHESKEFIERIESGKKYMTTSCCPGFLGYIEKKFPDQLENVSNTVSPMIAIGRMIKEEDKDSIVVFVGPCTAKKSEIKRDGVKDAIDYVMTFEEIAALFGAFEVEPEECEEADINDASNYGRGFAQGGGVVSAIENCIKDKEGVKFNPIRASGPDEIKRAMIMAKVGKLSENFIEGMMCEGGCIGGPATMVSEVKAKAPLRKFSQSSTIKNVKDNKALDKYKDINMER